MGNLVLQTQGAAQFLQAGDAETGAGGGKLADDAESAVGAQEVAGSDLYGMRADENEFQHVLGADDAADADDRNGNGA